MPRSMTSLETIPILTLSILLGGCCLSFTLLHLRVVREMTAQGESLDRGEIVQMLLWAVLTAMMAVVLVVVVLEDLLAGRS